MNNNLKPVPGRKRSGFTREFRLLDVFIFNVLGFALGLALTTNPAFIGAFAPNANFAIVIIIGAILAFVNGLTYGWFGGVMPNTGGDYVFVTRSLGPRMGFITSWGFTACQIYGLALNTNWLLDAALKPLFLTHSYITNDRDWLEYGNLFTPSNLVVGTVIMLLIYYFISISKFSINQSLTKLLFALGIAGPVILVIHLFLVDSVEFVSKFNDYIAYINPDKKGIDAFAVLTASMEIETSSNSLMWKDSIKALPLGFLCFLGFTYSVYVGGEVERAERSQVLGILFALALGVLIFTLGMGRFQYLVGSPFISAIGTQSEMMTGFGLNNNSLNVFVGILISNPAINILMQLGILIWFLFVPFVMLQVCSRNLIAWTTDELAPSIFLKRTKKTDQVWVANLIVVLVAICFYLFIHFTQISLVGAIALAAVAYFITSISAVYFPMAYGEEFSSKAPESAKHNLFGLPLTNFQLSGVLGSVGFGWIIYAAVTNPDISGGSVHMALGMLLVVYLSGLIYYEVRNRMRINREEDLDWDTFMKEIPQD